MGLFWKSNAEKEAEQKVIREQQEREQKEQERRIREENYRRRIDEEKAQELAEAKQILEKITKMSCEWELTWKWNRYGDSGEDHYAIKCVTSNGYEIELRTWYYIPPPFSGDRSEQKSEVKIIDRQGDVIVDKKYKGPYGNNVPATACGFIQEYVEKIAKPLVVRWLEETKKQKAKEQAEKKSALDKFLQS